MQRRAGAPSSAPEIPAWWPSRISILNFSCTVLMAKISSLSVSSHQCQWATATRRWCSWTRTGQPWRARPAAARTSRGRPPSSCGARPCVPPCVNNLPTTSHLKGKRSHPRGGRGVDILLHEVLKCLLDGLKLAHGGRPGEVEEVLRNFFSSRSSPLMTGAATEVSCLRDEATSLLDHVSASASSHDCTTGPSLTING